jgi:hypothetical protein
MKTCGSCKEELPSESFAKASKAKDGLQSRCKSCCAKWYRENKVQHVKNVQRSKHSRRVRLRESLLEILSCGCTDCGTKDVRVLDFDHLEGSEKLNHVSVLVNSGESLRKVLKEIAKCEVATGVQGP